MNTQRTQADRREEAESRLVEAAIGLMAKKGYDGFTLQEVGQAAGYSRGLPGHYFGRKEDLLALVAQHTADAYNVALARLPPTEPGLPRLIAKIRQYAEGVNSTANRVLFILIAEAVVRPGLRRTFTRLNARGLESLEEDIRAGIDAGNIRADVDPDRQARLIYAYLRGQSGFAALDGKFDARAVGEEFIATLEVSIGARSGR